MEDWTFNETIYSLPGIAGKTTDVITYKFGDLLDISSNIPNTTSPTISAVSSPDGNGTHTGPSDQETRRLVGFFFLMVCTIAGNITLIAALMCKRSRRIKRVNVFIVNLAISDLAVAFITISAEILFIAFGEWVLGPALCKVSVYLEIVTLAAATFLLTAMSIDRYQVIVKPLQSLANRPKISIKVTLAWCLAFIFAFPQIFIFNEETKIVKGRPKHACKSNGYNQEWQRKLYFTFLTSYILIIPAIVMTYCYLNIMIVIWRRSKNNDFRDKDEKSQGKSNQKLPASPRMSVNRNLVSSSRKKVIKLTLTVIVGFLACLTPYFLVSLVRIYSTYTIQLEAYLPAAEMIFLTHSALNPILFGIFTFRLEHLSYIVPRACKRCLFDGLKDSVARAPATQRTLRGANGQLRLIGKLPNATARPQEKLNSYDGKQTILGLNVNCDNPKKPLLRQPVVQTAVVVDTKENGSITMHLLKSSTAEVNSSEQHSDKSGYDIERVPRGNSVTFNYNNVQRADTDSTVDRTYSCSDADKELTEYVSCV